MEKLPRRSLRNRGSKRTVESTSESIDENIDIEPPVKRNNKSMKKDGIQNVSKSTKKQKGSDVKTVEVATSTVAEVSNQEEEKWKKAKSFYEFSARDLNGKDISMKTYKGQVCIVVNVASRCGHTKSNYEQFVEIYEKYSKSNGLRILAFPCNQFGKQEPGDSNKICEFIKKRNVEFDVFEKIDVNGKNAHPLWNFMKNKIAGPKGHNIDWNFTKFIVDKEGNIVERHKPSIKPLQIVDYLKKYW